MLLLNFLLTDLHILRLSNLMIQRLVLCINFLYFYYFYYYYGQLKENFLRSYKLSNSNHVFWRNFYYQWTLKTWIIIILQHVDVVACCCPDSDTVGSDEKKRIRLLINVNIYFYVWYNWYLSFCRHNSPCLGGGTVFLTNFFSTENF